MIQKVTFKDYNKLESALFKENKLNCEILIYVMHENKTELEKFRILDLLNFAIIAKRFDEIAVVRFIYHSIEDIILLQAKSILQIKR